jgi:hypothetical protein
MSRNTKSEMHLYIVDLNMANNVLMDENLRGIDDLTGSRPIYKKINSKLLYENNQERMGKRICMTQAYNPSGALRNVFTKIMKIEKEAKKSGISLCYEQDGDRIRYDHNDREVVRSLGEYQRILLNEPYLNKIVTLHPEQPKRKIAPNNQIPLAI